MGTDVNAFILRSKYTRNVRVHFLFSMHISKQQMQSAGLKSGRVDKKSFKTLSSSICLAPSKFSLPQPLLSKNEAQHITLPLHQGRLAASPKIQRNTDERKKGE